MRPEFFELFDLALDLHEHTFETSGEVRH
jgi:hypothetical protein